MAEKLQACRKLRKTIMLANCPFCGERMLAERKFLSLVTVGCSNDKCCLSIIHGVFVLEDDDLPRFLSSFNSRSVSDCLKLHRTYISIHPACLFDES